MRVSRMVMLSTLFAVVAAAAPSLAACPKCGREHGGHFGHAAYNSGYGGDMGRFLFGKHADWYPQLGFYLQQGIVPPTGYIYAPPFHPRGVPAHPGHPHRPIYPLPPPNMQPVPIQYPIPVPARAPAPVPPPGSPAALGAVPPPPMATPTAPPDTLPPPTATSPSPPYTLPPPMSTSDYLPLPIPNNAQPSDPMK